MKKAHSSGKLKGTKKVAATAKAYGASQATTHKILRKRFIERWARVTGGETIVNEFYEMLEPLDKEVAELRTKVSAKIAADLSDRLDKEIETNVNLYDRLMLALDGERPPKGILFTVEALAPFAAMADIIERLESLGPVKDDDEIAHLTTADGEPRSITVGHLRDAAKSYEHFIGKRKP